MTRSIPLMTVATVASALLTLAPLAGAQRSGEKKNAAAAFTDPAVPTVNDLAPIAAPKPTDHAALTVHRAPGPLPPGAVVEDWPSFMGPRRDLRSRETGLDFRWPAEGPPLVWEMKRGQGMASPAVRGDRLVYTHRIGDTAHIDCLQATTGRRYWRFSYPCKYRGRYFSDHGPRATPVISGDHVYVHGVEGMLHCFQLATGRVAWKRDTKKDFDVGDDFFGVVSTPLVWGDLLLQNIGGKKGPSVAAFDKGTGKLVWGAGRAWGPSCASPVLGTVRGHPRLFVLAGGDSRPPTGGLMVLDPKTGAVDFSHPFRSRTYESVIGSSPVVGRDWVFISSSYGVGSAVLDLRPDGGFTQRWKSRRNALQFSNGLFVDDSIWAVVGRSNWGGRVVRIDPATGKDRSSTELSWDETVAVNGPTTAEGTAKPRSKKLTMSIGEGSLLHVDGGFLCLGDNGHLLRIVPTADGVEVEARAWLFKARWSWTPLVLSRGLLYVCQNAAERFGDAPARLLCYDLRRRSD